MIKVPKQSKKELPTNKQLLTLAEQGKVKIMKVYPAQYAAMRGTKNKSAISRAIRNQWELKGVIRVDKYGSSFTIITVLVDSKEQLIATGNKYDLYQF